MVYKTSDLNLSAFLKAKYNLKIKYLEPDLEDKERALFVFEIENDVIIKQYIVDYYNCDDNCSVNGFMRELNDLRSWLRSFRVNKIL